MSQSFTSSCSASLQLSFFFTLSEMRAVTFSACSPLCAIFGLAPDELHLPKNKRRHSCLCLSVLAHWVILPKQKGTAPPSRCHKLRDIMFSITGKSITPLKDLQTKVFVCEVICLYPPLISPLYSADPLHVSYIIFLMISHHVCNSLVK